MLDNLSALCRYGNENEGESWLPMQEWGLALRRRGISVLSSCHHAGKNKTQRGTSRRRRLARTRSITLRPPAGLQTKRRSAVQKSTSRRRGACWGNPQSPSRFVWKPGPDGRAIWTHRDVENARGRKQAAELFAARPCQCGTWPRSPLGDREVIGTKVTQHVAGGGDP